MSVFLRRDIVAQKNKNGLLKIDEETKRGNSILRSIMMYTQKPKSKYLGKVVGRLVIGTALPVVLADLIQSASQKLVIPGPARLNQRRHLSWKFKCMYGFSEADRNRVEIAAQKKKKKER